MKKVLLLVPFVCFVFIAASQTTDHVPTPLTDKEKLHLRDLQVRTMQAEKLLEATTEYKNLELANQDFNKDVESLYKDHNTDRQHYQLCDGPGTDPSSPCINLKTNDIQWAEVPKKK